MDKTFNVGDQIAYIPHHAEGDVNHPDVELGFVTGATQGGNAYFCRYWRKERLGVLRTVANSESTPVDCMVRVDSVDQTIVDRLLVELGYKEVEP
jgi:hypothetical protein